MTDHLSVVVLSYLVYCEIFRTKVFYTYIVDPGCVGADLGEDRGLLVVVTACT